ncbi:MAG: DUF2695 domain-containing protein [Clostridia bacterium]|nr:DUF2695 domain-containing protein [Clostridia bacterium]
MENYLLSLEQVASLFDYLDEKLEEDGCDNTLRYTKEWLAINLPEDQHEAILAEMEEMGGYCDCEVVFNCYEDYQDELYDEEEE